MSRILGLDPGEKRIGVAITDPLGITAQGLEVITFTNLDEAFEKLEQVFLNYDIVKIVVGNPLNMNGTKGPAAEKALHFAQRLRQIFDLEVVMIDERLSSVSAEKALLSGGVRRKKRRAVKDKLAAALILEAYISSQANNCS